MEHMGVDVPQYSHQVTWTCRSRRDKFPAKNPRPFFHWEDVHFWPNEEQIHGETVKPLKHRGADLRERMHP